MNLNSDEIITAIRKILDLASVDCSRSQQTTILKVVGIECLSRLSDLARKGKH